MYLWEKGRGVSVVQDPSAAMPEASHIGAGVSEWHIRRRTVYLCQAPGGMISEGKWV